MKILYICSADLSGETGSLGSVRHIIEVSGNLQKSGNQVKLIVPKYALYNHPTPFDIIYVPILKVRFLRTLIYELLAPFFLLVYLAFWKPDIIYWRQAYLTIFPVLLSRIFGKKIVTEVNGLTIDEIESEALSSIRKKIILNFERFNYKNSSHLICVAPEIRKRILDYYKLSHRKVSVILNGVNSDRMPVIKQKKAKKEIDLEPDLKVVGFVGHFFPWDGIEYLIEAAEIIVKQMKDVRFLIIGHGKWGKHLNRLVEQKKLKEFFIFTGKVPWEELYLYINAFDIATAPYSKLINIKSGRSSLKLLEYFACEKPVIASNTSVIPEIIDINKKKLGLTVEPENSDDLANAILLLLRDKHLRKKLGSGGRAYVVKERNWKIVAHKTLTQMQDLLASS